jgi:hypothetical protein
MTKPVNHQLINKILTGIQIINLNLMPVKLIKLLTKIRPQWINLQLSRHLI